MKSCGFTSHGGITLSRGWLCQKWNPGWTSWAPTSTNPHYLRAWNRLFQWVRSLVCPKESLKGGGGILIHISALFFISILQSHYFLYFFFLNSFLGFQKQYNKTKLINKAHSIVWFERRHRLMCTWLISICHSNVWFLDFPIYRKKNLAHCAQTLANPASLVKQ